MPAQEKVGTTSTSQSRRHRQSPSIPASYVLADGESAPSTRGSPAGSRSARARFLFDHSWELLPPGTLVPAVLIGSE